MKDFNFTKGITTAIIDGEIIEYDECFDLTANPLCYDDSDFIGEGYIYSVDGVRQSTQSEFDEWCIENGYETIDLRKKFYKKRRM